MKLILFSTQNENIRLERLFLFIAPEVDINIREVEATIRMQAFAVFDSDFRSPFARKTNTSHTGHILPEIIDVCFLVHFAERDGGESLYITMGRTCWAVTLEEGALR